MTHPIGLLHPRKLHAMICACPTTETRARAALEFLRGSTQSEDGYLFLMLRGEFVLAASSQSDAPAGLADEAARAWRVQLATSMEEEPNTKTIEMDELQAHNLLPENPVWMSRSGDAYALRMLSTFHEERWVSAGLVMLKAKDPRTLVSIRHVHLQALCSALVESGDVTVSTESQAATSP